MSHERTGESYEWYTPPYVFKALECKFDIDVASPIDRKYCSVPALNFITENSLDLKWNGFIWMNPPFGNEKNKMEWLEKFFQNDNGIALMPDRSSAKWWQYAAKKSERLLMVNKKIKFYKSDGTTGNSPSNGTTLFATSEMAVKALYAAQKNNFGLVLKK